MDHKLWVYPWDVLMIPAAADRVEGLAAAGAQGIHYCPYGLRPRQDLGWIARAAVGMASTR